MHINNIIYCIKVDRTLLTVYIIDDIILYREETKVNNTISIISSISVLYFAAVGKNTIITCNFTIHSYDGFSLDIDNSNIISIIS